MGVLVIAEAGVNHNGDIELAKSLIDVAAEAGADYVKFQTFKAATLLTKYAIKAEYQKQNGDREESQYQMIKRLELSQEMHEVLMAHCVHKKISYDMDAPCKTTGKYG